MEEEDTTLYLQLHSLPAATSDKSLAAVLSTLWRTRRTGVGSSEKSRVRFLLTSPPNSELDPVLACLRSLIRKVAHDDCGEEGLLRLLPPDLPLELRSNLILLLLRHKNQWRQELSGEQNRVSRNGISTFTNFSHSEPSTSTARPYRDDLSFSFDRSSFGSSTLTTADSIGSLSGPVTEQHDDAALQPPASMPRLKSMSWTMEASRASTSKVAHVTLKLEDHAGSPSGETEIKFQLTKDAFDSMLRSMTHINEQLSTKDGATPEPLQKRPRQAN